MKTIIKNFLWFIFLPKSFGSWLKKRHTAYNPKTGIRRKLSKSEIKYIKAVTKYERKNNTFFGEAEIKCNAVKCVAGMGMAGMGKCFLKGNNKPNCPKFEDDKEWLEKMEQEETNE